MATGYKTGGRQKGTPNKATNEARQAISLFVEGNIQRLQEWLDRIADDDPQKAFDSFMKVVEYHIPKLSRAEHTGADGGAIEHSVKGFRFWDAESAIKARTRDPLAEGDD